MSDREKWDRAVQKLIVMTDEGKLNWTEDPFVQERHSDAFELIGKAYTTAVAGRPVSVFEYAFGDRVIPDIKRSDTWDDVETDVAIEFAVGRDLIWRWPQTLHRWELLETIRGQYAGASDFLDTFLASEGSP